MNNTLIAFASRHGAVEKCARQLFRLINGNVDLCNLEEREFLPDLSVYDFIVIGGSIYSEHIQQVVTDFYAQKMSELKAKKLGLFICCMYSGEKAQEQLQNAYPQELTSQAIVCDYFGGEIDDLNLSFWERIVALEMIEKDDLIVALSKEKIEEFARQMNACP